MQSLVGDTIVSDSVKSLGLLYLPPLCRDPHLHLFARTGTQSALISERYLKSRTLRVAAFHAPHPLTAHPTTRHSSPPFTSSTTPERLPQP